MRIGVPSLPEAGAKETPVGSVAMPALIVPGTMFIAGEPMKPATNTVSGRS
jgi:hypothetical protein